MASHQPTGTVTLVFSDVEGSTRLLHRLGRDVYARALEEHRRVVREASEQHGGYVVDSEGDSMFVAFRTAADAVAAAVEAQLELARHDWPEEQSVRIRMGIHTGEPLAAPPRYVGLDVHRAARIAAAAHGGQVLLSDATERLLAGDDRALRSVGLTDLGLWRLKDFDKPVRLYQLTGEGLQQAFPSVRAERSTPERRRLLQAAAAAATVVVAATVAAFFLVRGGTVFSGPPNSLAVIDAHRDKPLLAVPVGIQPGPVAFGGDSVLVGNLADRTLSRIDPQKDVVERTIPLGDIPSDIAAVPSAWALEFGHPLQVALLATSGDQPTTTATYHQECDGCSTFVKKQVRLGDTELDASGVAFGAGSVWAVGSHATFNPDTVLIRVSPASGRILESYDWEANTSVGIAVAKGVVWVAARGDNAVWELNASTGDVLGRVTVGNEPSDVAYGDGSVWVTTSGDSSLWRLDAHEGEPTTVRRVIPVGSRPAAVAVAPDAVWVANRGDGTVSRVDPKTDRVVATIHVGSAPSGIAVGAGRVWTTLQAAGP